MSDQINQSTALTFWSFCSPHTPQRFSDVARSTKSLLLVASAITETSLSLPYVCFFHEISLLRDTLITPQKLSRDNGEEAHVGAVAIVMLVAPPSDVAPIAVVAVVALVPVLPFFLLPCFCFRLAGHFSARASGRVSVRLSHFFAALLIFDSLQ